MLIPNNQRYDLIRPIKGHAADKQLEFSNIRPYY